MLHFILKIMVKLTKRKGFNFFRSYYDVFNELNKKAKLEFIEALLDKQFLGINPKNLKGQANFAFISQMHSIEQQVKGYQDKTGDILLTTPTAPPTVGCKNTPTIQVEVIEKEKEKVIEEIVYKKNVHTCLFNCLKFFPEHLHPKESQVGNWLDTIDKLNRIENLPFDIIEGIVKKTREDDFWSKNFLAIPKLRKKDKNGVMYILVFKESVKNGGKGNEYSEDSIRRADQYLTDQGFV